MYEFKDVSFTSVENRLVDTAGEGDGAAIVREAFKYIHYHIDVYICIYVYTYIWRRKWQPTPVFLPGKSHGQRGQVGYSRWDLKESDMTEQLNTHAHTHMCVCVYHICVHIFVYTIYVYMYTHIYHVYDS